MCEDTRGGGGAAASDAKVEEGASVVCGTSPLAPNNNVMLIKGEVVKGFGRGSKELGIPTANLEPASFRSSIGDDTLSGIYCGFASKGEDAEVYKMVMSIGWNPFYKNKERTAEAWLLHDFEHDFYGVELRVVVCGYIRPEADFESVESLVARIHEDARVARAALDAPAYQAFASDAFLRPT